MICETLQSELSNFTSQFFGPVTKTDGAPGVVNWELPCGLDSGLVDNPRGFDEGISCYFLRLFRDKIAEFAGPPGTPGAAGANGYSGYTVSLQSFFQPVTASPFVLRSLYNPVIKEGEIVYVDRSGWYQVVWVDNIGNLTLSLIQPMLGASGIIPSGRVIVPVGPKGQDQTGPVGNTGQVGDKGATGPVGDQGPAGADGVTLIHGATEVNGDFIGKFGMSEFEVRATTPAATLVSFGTTDDAKVSFELVSAGTYLFKITSNFRTTGDSAVLYTGLVDTTTPASNVSPDPAGTNKFLPGSYTNSRSLAGGVQSPLTLCCLVTTPVNYSTIQWQAFGQRCNINPEFTFATWVRLT
jgi:hypothetical protein